MTELPEQLARAAGQVDETLDLSSLRRRAAARTVRRRAARVAGAALAALLVAGGVAIALNARHSPASQQLTASGGDTTGADQTTTTSPSATTSTPSPTTVGSVPTTIPPIGGPDPTTVPPTLGSTTMVPVPTQPQPQPQPIVVAGTFSGQNPAVEPSKGGCAEMAHRFDGTMRLAEGPYWQLHEDYCGIVVGSHWSGSGTFTIDVDENDGDVTGTITGTFTSEATLPTTGEPYTLSITGGTGSMAGAGGSCAIDNHVLQYSLADQLQYGSFSCRITGTSPSS